ncbi:hypothetical protein PIB30_019098 [Stylosanthes scabra]|uniref:Uncharacterized protein n=1 Tax=Stylosanthes scabra TaxID=79078 RepID=A0ABU6U720_9FABA|nr:hypothetical protein [Stylosanthes scabra]
MSNPNPNPLLYHRHYHHVSLLSLALSSPPSRFLLLLLLCRMAQNGVKGGFSSSLQNGVEDSDLQPPKPFHRRKPRTLGKRLRKLGAPNERRSKSETSLLKWKIHEGNNVGDISGVGNDDPVEED